ncbi:LINE-1 retrotransposable element ORF2 protein [Holothuria leucospilota]|uniref:LINE-1 retrotransposable element ORF2 protein n=1 Tax=Holothuria leucospilota TaxID=206669 RepID=A0A9Q1C0G4_HOLLE|nr:LINE-1 retrotransposable element ORF2 protein [Holothuria leucospilota]
MWCTLRAEWGYELHFSGDRTNARGAAILLNNNFAFKIKRVEYNADGNYVAISVEIENHDFTILSIYGPNRDTPNFYHHISELLGELNDTFVILGGDWNCVLDPSLDCDGYLHDNNPMARNAILNMLNDYDLSDPYRVIHPNRKVYTWRKLNPLKQARLDYFLVSNELLSFLDSVDIGLGYRTDHSLVHIKFVISNQIRGRSYWKFNTSLLRDTVYIDLVREVIRETVSNYIATPINVKKLDSIPNAHIQFRICDSLFLEILLMNIRGKSVSHSSWKKKEFIKKRTKIG